MNESRLLLLLLLLLLLRAVLLFFLFELHNRFLHKHSYTERSTDSKRSLWKQETSSHQIKSLSQRSKIVIRTDLRQAEGKKKKEDKKI